MRIMSVLLVLVCGAAFGAVLGVDVGTSAVMGDRVVDGVACYLCLCWCCR